MSGRTIYEVPIVNEVTGDMKFPVSDGNVLPQTASLDQVSQFIQNPIKEYIKSLLEGYVKVVEGKGLSTNDFTNTLKEKLNGLENYDDSVVKKQISTLQTTLDSIVSGNASSAIESLNEIMAFLENIDDSETLEGILAGLMAKVTEVEQEMIELEGVVITTDEEDDFEVSDPDIVNEAIRKTPQTLTKSEQAQARTNIGAASLEENTAFKTEMTENNEAFKTEVNETVSSLSEGFSLFKESVQEQIDEQDESIEEYKEQTTAQVNEKISENFAKLIPTGMDVSCLTSLTRGNKSFVPIDVTMYPEGVVKNIICISDNKAVSVTPDGLMKVIGVGESTVHVVPTMNTSLAKTLEIKVTDSSVRLVNSLSIRLISSGSFRFN